MFYIVFFILAGFAFILFGFGFGCVLYYEVLRTKLYVWNKNRQYKKNNKKV